MIAPLESLITMTFFLLALIPLSFVGIPLIHRWLVNHV